MMGLDTKGHGKKVDAVCVVVVDVDREMLFVFFKKTRLVVEGFITLLWLSIVVTSLNSLSMDWIMMVRLRGNSLMSSGVA